MAWVKMEKNGMITEVPDVMYNKIYKAQGFKLVEPKPKAEIGAKVTAPKTTVQSPKPEIKPTAEQIARQVRKPKVDVKIIPSDNFGG